MSDIILNILVVIGISFSYGCYWDTVNCDQITLIIFGSKLLYLYQKSRRYLNIFD